MSGFPEFLANGRIWSFACVNKSEMASNGRVRSFGCGKSHSTMNFTDSEGDQHHALFTMSGLTIKFLLSPWQSYTLKTSPSSSIRGVTIPAFQDFVTLT